MTMEDVNIVEEKKESSFEQQGQHDKRPSALDELDHVFDQCAEAPYEDDNKPSTLRQRRGNTGLPDEEGFYSSGAHDGSSKNFSNLSDSGNGQDNEEKDPKTEDDDEVEESAASNKAEDAPAVEKATGISEIVDEDEDSSANIDRMDYAPWARGIHDAINDNRGGFYATDRS